MGVQSIKWCGMKRRLCEVNWSSSHHRSVLGILGTILGGYCMIELVLLC